MRAAAHKNPRMYDKHYQPSTSRVDGQASFLGNSQREIVSEVFLELSIPYKPDLAVRLPAEQQYNLERSDEYRDLQEQIAALSIMEDAESKHSLNERRLEKIRLEDRTLREWRRAQPSKPNSQPEYARTIFSRCRFMMSERDGLAKLLFEQPLLLRDPEGLCALSLMQALLLKTSEVDFRPGLEPQKCVCPKMEGADDGTNETRKKYDWMHVYNCFKTDRGKKHGFAELCFLEKCNVWIFDKQEWEEHCLGHLQNLDAFPLQVDPLILGGVLAAPGYCPWCLRDKKKKLPSKRMHHWIWRQHWSAHVREHIEKLERREKGGGLVVIECPHANSGCPKSFQSVLQLRFHLQDIHGIDMNAGVRNARKRRKRPRDGDGEEMQRLCVKRSESQSQKGVSGQCGFINSTLATMGISEATSKACTTSLGTSTPSSFSSSGRTLIEDDDFGSDTPLSPGDGISHVIDPALLQLRVTGGDAIPRF
jgi:hypothetical protein